jgi:DNA repair protein RadC
MADRDREPSFTIRDLPREERPRERLQKLGSGALSSVELLALVIGRGVPGKSALTIAHDLLKRFRSVQGVSSATVEELSAVPGIGMAKAAQLKAAFELGKRQDLDPEKRVGFEINNPGAVAKAVRASIADKAKEHFKLLVLNTRNEVIVIVPVSVGTANASLVHPREVFKAAISHGASSVVLAHNHPSGNPEPSDDDIALTRRLVEAGRLLGIEVLDHIIVVQRGFISFKEKGLL